MIGDSLIKKKKKREIVKKSIKQFLEKKAEALY